MKNRGGGGGGFFMKQIMSMVSSLGRAKSLARLLKNKANALRTRLIIFSLLRDKRLMTSSITQKIHSLTSHHCRNEDHDDCQAVDDVSSSSSIKSPSSIVLYNQIRTMILPINPTVYEEEEETYSGENNDEEYTEEEEEANSGENNDEEYTEEEEDGGEKYPDLTHSLFESDMDLGPGSVIEMVKNEKGDEFKLEEEIDRVADLFIEKFHRQMRLQKQLSIKRYQEMLERSA